jgi:hypothetical protein
MVNDGRGRCRILPRSKGRMTVYDGRWTENLAAEAVRIVSISLAAPLLGLFAVWRPLKRFFVLRFSAIQSTLLIGGRRPFFFKILGKKDGLHLTKSKNKGKGMEDGRYGTFCVGY